MKLWQKFLFGIAGIVVVAVLAINCYWVGDDLLELLPLWLSKFMLGAAGFIIIIVIVFILISGITKIKELFQEG